MLEELLASFGMPSEPKQKHMDPNAKGSPDWYCDSSDVIVIKHAMSEKDVDSSENAFRPTFVFQVCALPTRIVVIRQERNGVRLPRVEGADRADSCHALSHG